MNFATLMLIAWVPITAMIFQRFSPEKSVVISLLWGYLFLPQQTGFDLPILPTLDKHLIPSLATLAFYLHAKKRDALAVKSAARRTGEARQRDRSPVKKKLRGRRLTILFVILLLASCIITLITNGQNEVYGPVVLPAMSPYDTLAMLQNTIFMLLPLWLARDAISNREMIIFTLKALVIAALVYSILILFEARISPQLHRWFYGFHAHGFQQHIRGGNFRAMVFIGHGLRVGIFILIALLAAGTLFRITTEASEKKKWGLAVLWLVPVLYLSRNSGAFFLCLVFLPLVMFAPARLQLLVAGAFSAIVLIYPMARGAGFIPTEAVVAQAEKINPARAKSLAFRLVNEDILLERANLKPLGGWGTWGRNRVYDTKTGKNLSVTDGTWIIQIGVTGWGGYLGLFSLLCLPPILLALRRKDKSIGPLEAGLCMMLTVNLIDMIPNSSLVLHAWLLAGILWARVGWETHEPEQPQNNPRRAAAKRVRSSATEPRSSKHDR